MRPRKRYVIATGVILAAIIGVGAIVSTAGAPPHRTTNPPVVRVKRIARPRALDIGHRINDERRARGLKPMRWDPRLAAYARRWASVMAHQHRMFHSDIGRLLGPYNYVGENVAYGSPGVSVSTLHVAWMKSDEHRANDLAPGFQNVGVGIGCASDGTMYASANFARAASAGPPPAAPSSTPKLPIVRTDPNNLGCH